MMGSPDFLIIGAMKAGTSSLFSWLGEQEEVVLPHIKEPDFFSDEANWRKGWSWYSRLFSSDDRLTGEASVSYTHPNRADTAARRIKEALPDVRLIFLMRHPLERLASEYRHQVQRGRENRPFENATSDPSTPYALRSRYFTCLQPFLKRFSDDQLLIVRTEDLAGLGWAAVMSHLGLSQRPSPSTAHNLTESKPGYTSLMRWLYDRGMSNALGRLPARIRRLGGQMLFRSDTRYGELLATSRDELSYATSQSIWHDIGQLEAWLGYDHLWDR